ncbi:sensor histidine kinase [Pontibacter beigongshangensis]|uniref:sensor histidine kinase n=1 Tax=Pontibacter beigongshangensis TaxID=2574733 RepID=UPI00164EDC67|nr:HAMP domain-containing sensor histidine kinase [Pontibacter beigongshangensis]
MKIRNKIIIYFSTTVIALTAVSFIIIYILFSEYREEEFQKQQKDKIAYTIKFLAEYTQMSENLANIMDELTIHDFYDEKLLIFDSKKNLIFSSLDDLVIADYPSMLNKLSPANRWIETKEGRYDIVGVYYEHNQSSFYALSKAYDAVGYTNMSFLRNVLIALFIATAVIVILVSLLLSSKISKPITALAENLNKFDLSSEKVNEIPLETSSYELSQLTQRFNELIKRTNDAFTFQKHTIHHISHQLKTPIAVLVSELEKIHKYETVEEMKPGIENQLVKTKSLGNIINVLLEISKIESGQQIRKQPARIDEMIFDTIEELNIIHPDFYFEVNYVPDEMDENRLIININQILVRQALQNLLTNCIAYSTAPKAKVVLDCSSQHALKIQIINTGNPITREEEKFLFGHIFRGSNSQGKIGFGLGLVLTNRIVALHQATITYANPAPQLNVFELSFPLS